MAVYGMRYAMLSNEETWLAPTKGFSSQENSKKNSGRFVGIRLYMLTLLDIISVKVTKDFLRYLKFENGKKVCWIET